MRVLRPTTICAMFVGGLVAAGVTTHGQQPPAQRPNFSAKVEVVNVTVTVADTGGRLVPSLSRDDFSIFEDNVRQTISYFSASRAPVSLGLIVDASGSMVGEKTDAARNALRRFIFELLDPEDELFLYRFNDEPTLLQDWTSDRTVLSRALSRLAPSGGTALYDAVSEALPLATEGRYAKKALVIISDGNDTSSRLTLRDLQAQIRESGVMVYAVGIDADAPVLGAPQPARPGAPRRPPPPGAPGFPPRPRGPGGNFPGFAPQVIGVPPIRPWPQGDDRVNEPALRELTDDSGGRTAIVRLPRDLNPATANIADELRRQYELAYMPTTPRDGRWHPIRVDVRGGSYEVRARRGYVAN